MELKLSKEDIEEIATSVALKIGDNKPNKLKTYTADEAASILKVHKNTIQNYIKQGLLKASGKGLKTLITHENLQSFLEQ